jgi:hypothetical protein
MERRAEADSLHLAEGEMLPGREIGIRIDQTLTKEATGTLVMLELEPMGLDHVRTELSGSMGSMGTQPRPGGFQEPRRSLLPGGRVVGPKDARPACSFPSVCGTRIAIQPGDALSRSDSGLQ